MNKIYFLLIVLITLNIQAQKKPTYGLYNQKGKRVSFKKMIKKLTEADVILFGEHHNNPITHWLQYETTKDIQKRRDVMLGFEMIEADNQEQLDLYMMDSINQKEFDTIARLWKNYKTDYKPLVDFAKKKNVKAIATNIPRRYASKTYKGGFKVLDSLSNKEKSWIAPLPIKYDANLPGYVKIKAMMGGHGGDNLPKAQAIKDATMAHFILKNKKENQLFIHYNGSFHSDDFEGIYWYLKNQNPNLNIMTITTKEVENVKHFNMLDKNKAHYIIQVVNTMTKTY